jgi:hypothetical protein
MDSPGEGRQADPTQPVDAADSLEAAKPTGRSCAQRMSTLYCATLREDGGRRGSRVTRLRLARG